MTKTRSLVLACAAFALAVGALATPASAERHLGTLPSRQMLRHHAMHGMHHWMTWRHMGHHHHQGMHRM